MGQACKEWTFPEKISFNDVYTYYSKIESDKNIPHVKLDCSHISEVHSSFIGFLITLREKVMKNNGIMLINCSEYLKQLICEMNLSDYFNTERAMTSFQKSA